MPDTPSQRPEAESETLDLGIIKVRVPKFRVRDAVEMVVGTSVVAMPLAMTEEVWDLGRDLESWRIWLMVAAAWLFIASFVYSRIYNSNIKKRHVEYVIRVTTVYGITLFVSALILWTFGKFDDEGLSVGLDRAMIIAMPASFAATVVDSLR